MPKVQTPFPARSPRASTGEGRGAINLRVEAETRRMIDDAAAVLGKTRTEFMIDSARSQAINVLLDQRMFVLEANAYQGFAEALDNPPLAGPALTSLMRRTPAWRR